MNTVLLSSDFMVVSEERFHGDEFFSDACSVSFGCVILVDFCLEESGASASFILYSLDFQIHCTPFP